MSAPAIAWTLVPAVAPFAAKQRYGGRAGWRALVIGVVPENPIKIESIPGGPWPNDG
jgi:hypothetical protein